MHLSRTKIDRFLSSAQRKTLCNWLLERSANPTGSLVETGLRELGLWEDAAGPSPASINEWLNKSLAFELQRRALAEDASAARVLAESAGDGLAAANKQLLDAEVFSTLRAMRSGEKIKPDVLQGLVLSAARAAQSVQRTRKTDADVALRDEQISKLQREREEWEAKRQRVSEQLELTKSAPAADADKVRAQAVAEIDRIMGLAK